MFHFDLGGVSVACDSVGELHEALNGSHPTKVASKKKARKGGSKMKAAWTAARKLSKEKGITVIEARALLAKKKK